MHGLPPSDTPAQGLLEQPQVQALAPAKPDPDQEEGPQHHTQHQELAQH